MTDLKEKFLGNVITVMAMDLTDEQISKLRNCLVAQLNDVDLIQNKDLPSVDIINNENIIKHFIATKKVAGLSLKTLQAYSYQIKRFFDFIDCNVEDVTTNSVRMYLAHIGMSTSKSYTDDIRRMLNSFFVFCENEEYITKNPCKRVERIKKDVLVKSPYDDIEIEQLREACKSSRDIALVDFLLSTGCRREEVCNVKLSDVDMRERSVLIKGKGNKWRYVYFSARCELHIREYLKNRNNDSEYLFCREKAPYNQLSCEGLANVIRIIGRRSKVENVHLHRFRRTFATTMANRGVALQDIKEMMGHSNVQTTLIYIQSNNNRIKNVYRENCT